MKRYLLYVRVSTDQQDVSIQIHNSLEHIKSIEKEPFKHLIFSDPDTTTHIPMEEREGLQALLKEVKRGDIVVVSKLDRLSRPIWEMTTIYYQIQAQRAKVLSIGEPNIEPWMVGIFGSLAEKERDNTRDRTKSGLKKKKETGERVGSVPYGYKLDPTKLQTVRENVKSYNKPYLLIPEEREQRVVAQIVQWSESGKSYDQIVIQLAREGYTNRKGKPFHKTSVARIVRQIRSTKPRDQLQAVRAVH